MYFGLFAQKTDDLHLEPLNPNTKTLYSNKECKKMKLYLDIKAAVKTVRHSSAFCGFGTKT